MNNITALKFFYGYYRKPRGGYPKANIGAISTRCPRVIVRSRENKINRSAKT